MIHVFALSGLYARVLNPRQAAINPDPCIRDVTVSTCVSICWRYSYCGGPSNGLRRRTGQPGHRLKQLRLRLELTLRDVEALSRRQVSGCGVAFPPRSLSAPMRLPRTYPAWI